MTANACEIAKNSLIRPFEGYQRNAYPDPGTGGEPITVGEGTTRYRSAGILKYGRSKVFLGDTLGVREAEDELDAEIDYIAKELDQLLTVELSDKQLAAMISFAYNMGISGSMRQIQRLNEGATGDFVRFHRQYINRGTPAEPGLRRRREAELTLFAQGTVMGATWINLVRHTVKEAPEYRAYLMDGSVCLEIKVFKTRAMLLEILRGTQAGNVTVGQEGWHVEPSTKIPDNKKLLTTVPYFSQRDYGGSQAWSICGCTSVAMVLAYYGLDVTPDTVLRGYGKASCQSPVGCEAVFEANKLKANSTYNGTWKQIRDQLDQDRPVVIHGRFTASGHIIVVIGYDEHGYWCNDPAGKWEQVNGDSYLDNPKNGAGVYYREEAMWKACGKDGDVWYSVAFR
jgi:GH24 family phage-related lysozyme (muramidase)/uncharacterized protein YvpB